MAYLLNCCVTNTRLMLLYPLYRKTVEFFGGLFCIKMWAFAITHANVYIIARKIDFMAILHEFLRHSENEFQVLHRPVFVDKRKKRMPLSKTVQIAVKPKNQSAIEVQHLNRCLYVEAELLRFIFGRFEFGHILIEILQMFTMHNLPHRAQVMTTF